MYIINRISLLKATIIKFNLSLSGKHYDIMDEFDIMRKAQDEAHEQKFKLTDFKKPTVYKPMIIVLFLMAFQQLCGINALSFNLATIFQVRLIKINMYLSKIESNISGLPNNLL